MISFLAEKEIKVMSSSAQLLDLNLIENFWHILKVKFHEYFIVIYCFLSKPQNAMKKYENILKKIWEKINRDVIDNLIQSMFEYI